MKNRIFLAIFVLAFLFCFVFLIQTDAIIKYDFPYKTCTTWGSYGSGDNQLSSPYKIYLMYPHYPSTLLISDSGNNCIKAIHFDGLNKVERWFPISGLRKPKGTVRVTSVGALDFVLIVDSLNNRILVYDLITHSAYGEVRGFSRPSDIDYDYTGYVYVVDTGNQCIKRQRRASLLEPFNNFIGNPGRQGSGDGQFNNPQGIAVRVRGEEGYVYVADTGNHRIQKFGLDGRFIKKWGSRGSGNGEFYNPQGIAVDKFGYVYVADTGNHRIQKFDPEGGFIAKWGSRGSGDGQFYYPTDIEISDNGDVYVADSMNHRIVKFHIEIERPEPVSPPGE